LRKIGLNLLKEIALVSNLPASERYHRNRIRTLAYIFTESLLDVSDNGNISFGNIKKAKVMMQAENRCIYDR
jgi:hypothetical protein